MKIAFFEIGDWEKDYLREELKDFELSFFSDVLSLDNADLAHDADIISIFINSKIDKEILSKLNL
jgi:D-lactate dehydrogenase